MEGRISREELLRPTSSSATATRSDSSQPRPSYSRPPGSSRGTARGYRRSYGNRYEKKEVIPEGMDMFIVQLLASGILLLVVMFAAIVDIESANAIASGLDTAFSKSTSFTELKEGVLVARDKLKGGAGSVLEIFGGEVDSEKADPVGASEEDPAAIKPSPQQPALQQPINEPGNVEIDAETLTEIYEHTEDYPKN